MKQETVTRKTWIGTLFISCAATFVDDKCTDIEIKEFNTEIKKRRR